MTEASETTPSGEPGVEAVTANGATLAAESGTKEAKLRFARALEEAKAGASALGAAFGAEAQGRASVVREQLTDKRNDMIEEAKVLGTQAKEKASALADDGKAKASDALTSFGRVVADTAPVIDEKLGEKYGDYARSAARSLQETAVKLDTKDFQELGDDAREMIRKSPGVAVGIAAVAGFMLARMFRGSRD
jgi:hypothetical protein